MTISFFRGFIKEMLGFVSFVTSIYLTYHFHEVVAALFAEKIASALIAKMVGSISVYVISTILFTMAKRIILKFLENIRLGLLDRFLGLVLGFTKGFVLSLVVYISVIIAHPVLYPEKYNFEDDKEALKVPQWLADSTLNPVFYLIKSELEQAIPLGFVTHLKNTSENATKHNKENVAKQNKK